ncbi:eCIS core domain-containing protein [Silvibacterium acidisoli]|uniref:eCIS core domain-containing protein n=1 Tax=Acidobacteriaceae bacterium ZG23-2 TaxID=2883246 RepID=UPI00406C6659
MSTPTRVVASTGPAAKRKPVPAHANTVETHAGLRAPSPASTRFPDGRRTIPVSHQSDAAEQEAMHSGLRLSRPESAVAARPHSSHARVDAEQISPALASPSHPLNRETREGLESIFRYDFSAVRVHSGDVAAESASALKARAYTYGKHIVFGPGAYQPDTVSGRRLLAHELTHVMQQDAGVPMLQRAPYNETHGPLTEAEEAEETWYQEMGVEEAFSDPAFEQDFGQSLEELMGQSLTAEEIHRQLLVRRAQPLSASAYQAGDPVMTLANMKRQIRNTQARIRTRNRRLAGLKKQGAAKAEIDAVKTEISSLEAEVKAIKTARDRLPKSLAFSTPGAGAPAGTGAITYAGIQVETAQGTRIAIEFAETTSTEHAEEVIIRQLETRLTPQQLHGARLTVVGDQVVCGERCVPALRQFAEHYGVESVDGVVFQRAEILPANFIGPPELASPRTSLRTMTQASSEGRPLVRRDTSIYRRPPSSSGPPVSSGAAGESVVKGAEQQVVKGAEQQVVKTAECTGTAEARVILRGLLEGFKAELKSVTWAKVARFGKSFVKEGIKGYATAKAVEWIIGESALDNDLAALDAANHAPHNNTAEKISDFEKEALSFLPPEIAIPLAADIKTINPLSAEFIYQATVQENQRNWEKFKEEYGDSDDAAQLYDQGQKAADDWYNGVNVLGTP